MHNQKLKKFLSLLLLPFLASCVKTNEVYREGEYELGSFTDYFFMGHDEVGDKKGVNKKEITLTNDSYWNGSNNGVGSVSFTPYVYKVTHIQGNFESINGFNLLPDWEALMAKGEHEDGYVWYWRDYPLSVSPKVIDKGGNDITSSMGSFEYISNDPSKVVWNGTHLEIKGAGETMLRIRIGGLCSEATISIKAPYGTRTGVSNDAPELFKPTIKDEKGNEKNISLNSMYDWVPAYKDLDDDSFFEKNPSFGRYYSLGRVDDSFKKGYLSKLYNGQLYCDGYHSLAFVCLENNGFTNLYSKTLDTGDYFLMSFRGGSDYTGGNGHNQNEPRISSFDLSVDFYYKNGDKFDYVTVTSENTITETDHGGEGTTMFGFRFSKIGLDPQGICGIGVHYSNFQDRFSSCTGKISSEMPKTTDYQFGLLLYEVMFPGASWN